MSNVVNLDSSTLRCANCRHSSDCPLATAPENVRAQASSRVRVLHRGDRLYAEGESAGSLYRVRTGVIKTSLVDAEGREQVTGFFGPGEIVGIDAVFESHHADEATALDTTSVCVIRKSALQALAVAAPQRMQALVRALGRRVREKDTFHMSLAQDSAVKRMANFLLEQSMQRAAADLDGDDVALCMSRGEIASYLALAVETVSRLLTLMQRDGIITVSRAHVRILDRDALRALADAGRRDSLKPSKRVRRPHA